MTRGKPRNKPRRDNGCKECGAGGKVHKKGCSRKLEIAADKMLADYRREECDCLSCKREFYLDRQHELRLKREKPGGLIASSDVD